MDRIIAAYLESLGPEAIDYLEALGAAAYRVAYLDAVATLGAAPRPTAAA